MSQNTLRFNELNDNTDFDVNVTEAESFDEKALLEEETSENDLVEEELLSKSFTQRILDAPQLYLGEIGYSPCLPQRKRFILHGVLCAVTCNPAVV